MYSKFLIAAAAAAALAAPVAAQAQQFHHDQMRVTFKDLDISTPQGAKALMRRLSSASTEVCGPAVAPFGPGDEAWRRACVQETLADAVTRVNRPMLTALLEQPAAAPLRVATADVKTPQP